jgi:hypothetical protein
MVKIPSQPLPIVAPFLKSSQNKMTMPRWQRSKRNDNTEQKRAHHDILILNTYLHTGRTILATGVAADA